MGVEASATRVRSKGDIILGIGRGSHLSNDGVRLARELGLSIGPFAYVAASDVPRTLETALAMGFSVDDIIPFLAESHWEAVIEEMGWHVLWEVDQPFAYVARVLPTLPQTKQMASHYAEQCPPNRAYVA